MNLKPLLIRVQLCELYDVALFDIDLYIANMCMIIQIVKKKKTFNL